MQSRHADQDTRKPPKPPIDIRPALLTVIVTALVIVLGLGALAWWAVGSPSFGRGSAGLDTFLEALRIALSVIAGIGGVIALLMVYRRQRFGEIADYREDLAEQREDLRLQRENTMLLHERFRQAVEQLGHDSPAVRLGGVHALATVADDWDSHEDRQMCIDVLCSYLRMPDVPEPSPENDPDAHAVWQARREVRHTILRTIAAHLRPDGSTTGWQGHRFDLRGITLDLDLDLSGARFPMHTVLDLREAEVCGGEVDFTGAAFSGGTVYFTRAGFRDGTVDFGMAEFSTGRLDFSGTEFAGGKVGFTRAEFSGASVRFDHAAFSAGEVDLSGSAFLRGKVFFNHARFRGGTVRFDNAGFLGADVHFLKAEFYDGSEVGFEGADFSDGRVDFEQAGFSPDFRFAGRAFGSAGVIRALPLDRLTIDEDDSRTENASTASR